ncbi:MAG: hypothetical protein ACR2FY_17855 [Pirellulaceae bacterium]
MLIHSVDHPDLPPFEMAARFKMEIVYFMTPAGDHGAPQLGPNEYWICREEAIKWLDDLVVFVVSPLDARSKAEIELTDEHEAWLAWMVENGVQHVRLG